MPTYEYACKQCGEHLEAVQKFTDEPLTACPACEGPLRKVFGSIGISFKGSGFYKNDSRSSDKGSKKAEKEPAATSDNGAKEGGSKEGGSKDGGTDTAKPKADAPAKADAGKSGTGSTTAAAS